MKTITFIYFINKKDSSGIELKIQNLSQNFISKIFPVDTSEGFLTSTLNLLSSFRLNSDYFFIRYNNSRNIFLTILLILLKIKGKKIILEIPTPIQNHIKEIFLSPTSILKKTFVLMTTWILGPFPFFFTNLVIQYAEEGKYFKLFTKKTLFIGNGIDVSSYSINNNKVKRFKDFKKYEMIVIANLAPWHGVNLLLEALKNISFSFHLHIIGDGPERKKLEVLSCEYGLNSNITFYGKLQRLEYLTILKKVHLGIGSLNWDLINIKTSSALKLREYVSAGLPVIFSSFDPDLSGNDNCIQVECNQKSILQGIIKSYQNAPKFSPQEQFDYAKKKLDMSIKVNSIIKNIN